MAEVTKKPGTLSWRPDFERWDASALSQPTAPPRRSMTAFILTTVLRGLDSKRISSGFVDHFSGRAFSRTRPRVQASVPCGPLADRNAVQRRRSTHYWRDPISSIGAPRMAARAATASEIRPMILKEPTIARLSIGETLGSR